MTLHVNFFLSSIQRFQNHYWFTVTHCTVSKAKEVALVILRLLSSCYHVQFCRTRKRNFFLQSASERKYCWLTSIGVLTRLKWPESISIEVSVRVSSRKISHTVPHFTLHWASSIDRWNAFLCLLLSSPFSASFFSASSLAGWSTFHEDTNSYKFTRVTLSKHSCILVIWGYQKAMVNQFTLFFWRYTVSKAVARCMWQ